MNSVVARSSPTSTQPTVSREIKQLSGTMQTCARTDGVSDALRLAVIDDHPMMRGGLVETFAEFDGFDVVATGGDAESAVRIAVEKAPDLMIVDLNMPGGGVLVLERLRQARCPVPIVIMSASDDFVTINTAFDAGARGFVSKGVTAAELIDVVRQAVKGAPFVTAVPPRDGLPGEMAVARTRFEELKSQEAGVLQALAKGENFSTTASRLGLAEQRINLLLVNIRRRMRLGRRIRSVVTALLARR